MKIKSDNLLLYRKRIIPNETILLKDDIILDITSDYLVTKWNAIRPKKDLHHGYSCYLFNEGIKVSKFFREDGSLLYWYCDIVDYAYDEEKNELMCTDLLTDVVIFPNGEVRVVDLDELAMVLDEDINSVPLISKSLKSANYLLNIIYNDGFSRYADIIDSFIQ